MKNQKNAEGENIIPLESIVQKILWIRGKKVMVDRDLARLYGVETKALNQAVKRNTGRFPEDFMFQLNDDESRILRSQIVTSKDDKALDKKIIHGGQRYNSYVFTELGIAMLSSVLRSQRAIQVNMYIMRAFVHMREMLATHKEITEKIEKMERKYDRQFRLVFDVMQKLLDDDKKPKQMIGFK